MPVEPAESQVPELEVCPYCRVVAGTVSAVRLYADDLVVAIFDPAPIVAGHLLLLTRGHYPSLTGVPAPVRQRLMDLAAVLGQAVMRCVDGDGFNLHLANGACAGQAIPHCCLQVIPRHPTDGFAWHWRALPVTTETLNGLATRVRERLAGTLLADEPAPESPGAVAN